MRQKKTTALSLKIKMNIEQKMNHIHIIIHDLRAMPLTKNGSEPTELEANVAMAIDEAKELLYTLQTIADLSPFKKG